MKSGEALAVHASLLLTTLAVPILWGTFQQPCHTIGRIPSTPGDFVVAVWHTPRDLLMA